MRLLTKFVLLVFLIILGLSCMVLANASSETYVIAPSAEQINGRVFTVPNTGVYRFTILNGSYDPSPDSVGSHNAWLTRVYFYIDRSVQWLSIGTGGELVPGNPDFKLGIWNLL